MNLFSSGKVSNSRGNLSHEEPSPTLDQDNGERQGPVRFLPWLALLISLFFTYQLWQHERDSALQKLQNDFDFRARETVTFIVKRMRIHEQTLRGFSGLFAVHHQLGRDEFHDYVESLQLENNYPGIQFVAFSAAPPPAGQVAQRSAAAAAAASGAVDENGVGAGDKYSRLVYFETLNRARQGGLSPDIFYSPSAHAAMARACDSGAMALSSKINLAAGAGREASSGFSLHMPIYRGGKVPLTIPERRANLAGWVTLMFDIKPLMENVLSTPFSILDIHIHDGNGISADALMYDSLPQYAPGHSLALLRSASQLEIGGHPWAVELSSTPAYETRLDEHSAYIIASIGMIVSPLLFLVIWLLIHGRALAMRQASRMTHELEQSEKRYRLMFEDNASMSCLIDLKTGRLVDVNPAAAAYWGYSWEELSGMNIFDINCWNPETIRRNQEQLGNITETVQFETRHRLKSGEIRDVEVFAGLLDYAEVPVYHVTFHDIGNRRQIEQDLIRKIAEASPVAVLMLDRKGAVLYANQMTGKTFCCPQENILGRKIGALLSKSSRARYAHEQMEYARNPYPVEIPEEFGLVGLRSDGTEFPIEMRIVPLVQGEQNVLIVSIVDISERKEAENSLRKLERAVEQTPISIVITSPSGEIEYVNPIFCEITGYSREEAIGQNPRLLQSGETSLETYTNLWQTISNGGVWRGELHNRKKNGELFWEEATISPVNNEAGDITNFIAVKEDITERKQIETDLKLAKEAAEAANRAKSEFLAMMSHEIRTPLNGVIGVSALLLDTPLTKEQQEFAGIVKQNAESLLFVINDILDFSKIEAGRLDVEVIDFDLRALIDDLSGMLVYRAREKDLDFSSRIGPDVPSLLRGDPGRLRQVLLNLVSNALKFTERGQVVLHVDLVEEGGTCSSLRFEVRDSGIGIPADKLSSLFTPFTQVDASTSRRYGGTGLGLAISKQLVELMGGEIGAESLVGSGSAFWFRLSFERQALIDQVSTGALDDLAGRRVLVVDGRANFRTAQNRLLNGWHCVALSADDAAHALAMLRSEQSAGRTVDAVIVNSLAEEFDYADFAEEIKSDATLARMPLVLVSATPQRGEARRMKEAGFDAYLTRTASADLLFRCLKQVIKNARGMASGEVMSARPFVTQHTLAESQRRVSILVVAAQAPGVGCLDCRRLVQDLHEKLGHRVEIASNGRLALDALARGGFDLILLDGQSPFWDVHDIARSIRAGMALLPDCDVPLVALLADVKESESDSAEVVRARALAAGLNDTLTKPIDALKLDRLIQQVLHKRSEAVAENPMQEGEFSLSAAAAAAGRHLRLLLAEDNPVNQIVAQGLLRKLGFDDVITVGNGQEAVEAVRGNESAFDLILMDCQMPVMDGFIATRTLREMGCRTPVVAITAHAMTGIQEQCLAAGMNGYVSKPIDPAEFARVLGLCLSSRHAADELAATAAAPSDSGTHAPFEKTEALERLVGDEALLGTLIGIFTKNWPANLQNIEQALDRGDLENATRECHTIRGSSLTIGAPLVGAIAGAMTELGKNGALEEMRGLLPNLIGEVGRFMDAAAAVAADPPRKEPEAKA